VDAIVLAGGYATRLWPITKHRPKMLLPVGETTVIDRILSSLEDDDRVGTVYVSTNEAFAEDLEAHTAEMGYEKAQLSVEEATAEDEKLGVVGALAQLVEREDIDDDLFVIGGDNLIGFDISEFIDYYERQKTAVLAAYDVGSYQKATSYGLVDLDGEQVVGFQEKPDDPKSTLASIACYLFPGDSVRFREYLAGENNPDEPGWYIEWLQSREDVYAFTFDGTWFDIGTPPSYLEAVEWALDGGSLISPDATVENSEIGETVHVMADATVTDSTLDRTLVFPGADIRGCDLDDSILGEDVALERLDVRDAVVIEKPSPNS
jgi:glucose-1-phosphate thymidylyltransferase